MSRREYQQERNEQHTQEALRRFQAEIARLNDTELTIRYQSTHNVLRNPDRPPSPRSVQEFVQLWKELRKRHQRREQISLDRHPRTMI